MAHALEAEGQRHQQGHRADAVGHHLHGLGARDLAHLVDRGRVVVLRDVVEGELRRARGERGAGAVVEHPDVVAVLEEVLGVVRLGGVDEIGVRRRPEARRQDHRPLGAAVEARQPQLDVVVGREEVDVGRAAPQRTVLARGSVGVERAGPGEDAAEGLVERAGEHPAELRHRAELVEPAVAADALHRGQLLGEVGQVDRDDALGRDRALAVALVDRDVEGGGVLPEVEAVVVDDLLVALEEEPAAVVGDERHRVEHLARGGVLLVADQQVEASALDLQRRGGERGRGHRAGQLGLVLAVVDEPVDVVGLHRHRELERRVVGLAALEPRCEVVELRGGCEPPHRLGELNPGAAHRHPPFFGHPKPARVPTLGAD